jgi:hypothetical protein
MTTLTSTTTSTDLHPPRRTPGPVRRTALVASGLLACALPTVFTVNISRMLLTGVESDHRFHQLTGQGLVLCALWLVPLLGLLRAGWRGERPSTALGYQHLGFVLTGVLCATVSQGGGAPMLMAVIGVPGALVWLALPQRPTLRARVEIHPFLAPVAMLSSALFVPYAVGQLQLQNAATGYHAQNPHLFDMAWMVSTVMVLALVSALLPAARHLAGWVAGASVTLGVAGLVLGEGTGWSLAALGLGLAAALGWRLTRQAGSGRTAG